MISIHIDQRTLVEANVSHEAYKQQLELALAPMPVTVVPTVNAHGGMFRFAVERFEYDGPVELRQRIEVALQSAWEKVQPK